MNHKNKWIMNRVGLINFWYYDEQIFEFSNGRMLLRGSNGSGKSVTMQSIIPLLLDGNMRPERLDPFGSRDRKMITYLLDENDDVKERTGYLFLELKREKSNEYITIGMGIKAERGKPMKSWYFLITDERRIGIDLLLYKSGKDKFTLSKKELENRVGSGGFVLEKAEDYLHLVNKYIFGFERDEEYKELIDLLIQIRTPKLSKGFKPTLLNEILSKSLQPLSDEDLRPMAESVESIDKYQMDLKEYKLSLDAANKIKRVYDTYNRYFLYERAADFYQYHREYTDMIEKIKEDNKKYHHIHNDMLNIKNELEDLSVEEESLLKEKQSLESDHSYNLKDKEVSLVEAVDKIQNKIEDKKTSLDKKTDRKNILKKNIEDSEYDNYQREKEISDIILEMDGILNIATFDEHEFFKEEFNDHLKEEYNFDLHLSQSKKFKGDLSGVKELIADLNKKNIILDNLQIEVDEKEKITSHAERELDAYSRQFEEEKIHTKDLIYLWMEKNKELVLDNEFHSLIDNILKNYDAHSDYNILKNYVWKTYEELNKEISSNLVIKEKEVADLYKGLEELKNKRKELEEKKEAEPFRTEDIKKSRKILEEKNIPYTEFYKLIEFNDKISDKIKNYVEESLLHMGILDALVIDEKYKIEILNLNHVVSDKYIFSSNINVKNNIKDVLTLSVDVNDIMINSKINSILNSISYNSDAGDGINEMGYYTQGVLTGTITKEYISSYIGVLSRRRKRQEEINYLSHQIEELEISISDLQSDVDKLSNRKKCLKSENDSFISNKDLEVALKDFINAEFKYNTSFDDLKKSRNKLIEEEKKIFDLRKEVTVKASIFSISPDFDLFVSAIEEVDEYIVKIYDIRLIHNKYINELKKMEIYKNQQEEIILEIDDLKSELESLEYTLKSMNTEIESIRNQLKLSGYEEKKNRIEYVINRIGEIPKIKSRLNIHLGEDSTRVKNLEDDIKKNKEEIEKIKENKEKYELGFLNEVQLKYVIEEDKILSKDAFSLAKYVLDNNRDIAILKKDDINEKFNKVFYENSTYLIHFNISKEEKFADSIFKRRIIKAKFKSVEVDLFTLVRSLEEEVINLKLALEEKDKELFEEILANTISKQIRGKIFSANKWVNDMNESLKTTDSSSSGLKLRLKWKEKIAETDSQMDVKDLVNLLKKDANMMKEKDLNRLSEHFRSKVKEARRVLEDKNGSATFFSIIRDTLDYRKWFQFTILFEKTGERQKELTDKNIGQLSGGERALSMYIPLFAAVVARSASGSKDAPKIISLDEAFAGVDNKNMKVLTKIMMDFDFNFILNSQTIWGDLDTIDSLSIYQLLRPNNAKYVSTIKYKWNGSQRKVEND